MCTTQLVFLSFKPKRDPLKLHKLIAFRVVRTFLLVSSSCITFNLVSVSFIRLYSFSVGFTGFAIPPERTPGVSTAPQQMDGGCPWLISIWKQNDRVLIDWPRFSRRTWCTSATAEGCGWRATRRCAGRACATAAPPCGCALNSTPTASPSPTCLRPNSNRKAQSLRFFICRSCFTCFDSFFC